MALFRKKTRRYSSSNNRNFQEISNKNKKTKYTLIISTVSLFMVFILAAVIITVVNNKNTTPINTETRFIEKETQVIKSGEIITINDPLLGIIEIEAVEGAAKNTYVNADFVTDENGLKSYYVDGNIASCTGIDLSEYQGSVDFEALKQSGIDYVMLRIGGRYYSEKGEMYTDSLFDEYYKGAKAAGLEVGAYFFSQAINIEEAQSEAEYIINALSGYDLDYPVAFDWETIEDDKARTDVVTGEILTDCAIEFCNTLNEAGYNTIIYSNTSLMYYMYDLERLKEYEFWVADYADYPSMYYHFTMWQYTPNGVINGIEGPVDLNICFKNY